MIVFFLASVLCHSITVIVIEVDEGGDRHWNNNIEFPCWYKGTTCKIIKKPIISENSLMIEKLNDGGYLLKGKFNRIDLETVGVTPYKKINAPLSGFAFFNNEYLIKIVECSKYPELNGMSVDLGGTVLNENGEFQVYFPPTQ